MDLTTDERFMRLEETVKALQRQHQATSRLLDSVKPNYTPLVKKCLHEASQKKGNNFEILHELVNAGINVYEPNGLITSISAHSNILRSLILNPNLDQHRLITTGAVSKTPLEYTLTRLSERELVNLLENPKFKIQQYGQISAKSFSGTKREFRTNANATLLLLKKLQDAQCTVISNRQTSRGIELPVCMIALYQTETFLELLRTNTTPITSDILRACYDSSAYPQFALQSGRKLREDEELMQTFERLNNVELDPSDPCFYECFRTLFSSDTLKTAYKNEMLTCSILKQYVTDTKTTSPRI